MPRPSAVASAQDLEFSVDRIADHETVFRIGEGHAIEEAFGLMIGELEFPGMPFAVVIDARLIAWAGGEEECFVANCFHTAEVEVFCAGNVVDRPMSTAVFRHEISAVRSTRPNFIVVDDAHAAQGFGAVARLRLPLGEGGGGEEKYDRDAHGGSIRHYPRGLR